MGKVLVIGIAGGSGSGKTTLTNQIAAHFPEDITVITHDNYYKAHDDMTYEERCSLNYDHPNAFDTELMIQHLKLLKEGNSVECPIYDYTIHNRSKNTLTIAPGKVIIVEGILIFENKELCDQMDIRIFVDTDDDLRIIRRIRRDVMERARSLDSVIGQYLSTVKPMHEQFVEPSKKNASLIVPEGGHNHVAMEMIMNQIRTHLHTQ
ncbi:MAG: uridine kinase, partial [Lachnospiraceae bacterium]|nr:uridine kinase [Lachnospiraceae bacterium]